MKTGKRYALGMGLVSVSGLAVSALIPAPHRWAVIVALMVGIVAQGPLGWWVVRSLGTQRLMIAWGIGMAVRGAIVVVAGFVLAPFLGWSVGTLLLPLVSFLLAFLGVEAVVLLVSPSASVRL